MPSISMNVHELSLFGLFVYKIASFISRYNLHNLYNDSVMEILFLFLDEHFFEPLPTCHSKVALVLVCPNWFLGLLTSAN